MTPAGPGSDGRAGVVDAYRAGRGAGASGVDEILTPQGAVRPDWRDLAATLDLLGAEGLAARREQARRLVEDDGVTYGGVGEQAPAGPWRLDPLPMILGAADWAALARGLSQRAELLDRLQADLYGPRELLRRGLIPPELVYGHAGFLRQCDGLRLPGPHQLIMVAGDVVRRPDGWYVLGDRAQAPSGAGYAMENRRIVSRVLPGLYRDTGLERLRSFFHTLRTALQEVAPSTAEAPRVVILTPGAGAETAFDQAFLSTLLGFPLVEGQDLTVREGRVWMRSLGRPVPVDVVLRRVDGWFCDPLELRADSRLGVPGLLQAARLGHVSIVNPPGAGVLENPALAPYLPALGQALLDEPLLLPSVGTWWCGDPASLSHVLAHLGSLVIRPIARGVGRANRFGWELSRAELDDLRRRIEAEPYAWCAQERLEPSTVPVVTDDGLGARAMVLRGFAVAAGGRFQLLAGGLARVAGQAGGLDVSSQAGALAKDVWVIDEASTVPASHPPSAPARSAGSAGSEELEPVPVATGLSARVAEDMFWLGRYAERAEDAARLLRVTVDLAGDHGRRPGSPGARALAVMLRALTAVTTTYPGFTGPDDRIARPHPELVRLSVDPSTPGTLAHAVRHTLRSAQAVREVLSGDTWLVIGALDRTLLEASWSEQPELHLPQALSRVLEGLLAFSGLAAESMVRDAGWYVMDAGRRIERALQLVALLRHTLAERHEPGVDELVLESVLIGAESVITHRRRHPGRPRPAGVLALLLLERDNPRGVVHQLYQLGDALHRLPVAAGERDDPAARLRPLLAWLREADARTLARATDGGARPELVGFLDHLAQELTGLADTIARAHFARALPPRPLQSSTPVVHR
jgi:uncharacterized circularly permuted ATP-grasp superfamily protein/uncharacterized alpha-E superfamily protein